MIDRLINRISEHIRRIIILILLFGFWGSGVLGQATGPAAADSLGLSSRPEPILRTEMDTVRLVDQDSVIRKVNVDEMDHSPRKAMIYGIALPGLGQAYNKKYWKIPFVYGVLGGAGYWVYYNTQGYRNIIAEYKDDQSDYNERRLRLWRRQLEISYITLAGAYALQVLDAYVDAYLFYWDVSPDLTLRMSPSLEPLVIPGGMAFPNYGFKCKLTF